MKYHSIIVACIFLIGCDGNSAESPENPESPESTAYSSERSESIVRDLIAFDTPQDVLIVEPWVLVTNTAYRPKTGTFEPGTITVLDGETRKVVNQIFLSQDNPQQLLHEGDNVFVLCTGQTQFDNDNWLNIALSDGALDQFSVESLSTTTGPEKTVVLPTGPDSSLRGGFGSMALSNTGEFMVFSSGLSAILYRIDMASMTLINGPENPIIPYEHEYNDTLTLAPHSDGRIRVASFNRDEVFFLDPSQDTMDESTGIILGQNDDLEGLIQTLELADGKELALFTIANRLSIWNPEDEVISDLAVVGPVSNAMAVHGDFVYVVNSGVNNLVRINWKTGEITDPFTVFPVGSNPWDIDISDDGKWSVVTLFQSDELAWVDMMTGNIMEITK